MIKGFILNEFAEIFCDKVGRIVLNDNRVVNNFEVRVNEGVYTLEFLIPDDISELRRLSLEDHQGEIIASNVVELPPINTTTRFRYVLTFSSLITGGL